MQQFIRSNPFSVPLLGLLFPYIFIRFNWDLALWGENPHALFWVGLIFLVVGLCVMLAGYVFNFRVWHGGRRLWGLFVFHVGLGLFLFADVSQEEAFPWKECRRGYALIEVRDSMVVLNKGSAGVVHCVGWVDSVGHRNSADLLFKVSGHRLGDKMPAAGRYWVPLKAIKAYQPSDVPMQPNWFRIMRALGVNGHLKWAVGFEYVGGIDGFKGELYGFRRVVLLRLRELLYHHLEGVQPGLMFAMLVGDKSGLDADLERQFGLGGLLHVLAVSGMHVALIMGALLWIFTGFGARGKPKISTLLVLIAAGWGYTFLTGASASVVRAMIGATWMWVGKFAFHRKQKLTHVLAGSGYIQWIFDPFCVEQLGFQLSYLAVLGIATLHLRWMHLYESKSVVKNWLLESLSLTMSATLFTMPLILWQFQSFPTWFLVGNLLLLPFFTMSVYGILLCLVLCWVPILGKLVFAGFGFGIACLLWLMERLELLPTPQLFSLPLGGWGLLFLGLLVWAVDGYFKTIEKFGVSDPVRLYRGKIQYQWLVLICILGVWGSAEANQYWCKRQAETFVIASFRGDFVVSRQGDLLRVEGDLRNSQTKKWLWQKLQNYSVQCGVKKIDWVLRLPLLHE